jgi:hypothetical protein
MPVWAVQFDQEAGSWVDLGFHEAPGFSCAFKGASYETIAVTKPTARLLEIEYTGLEAV